MTAETEPQTDTTGGRCGTIAGRNVHVREQTPTCPDCRRAFAEYQRERRDNNPDARKYDREFQAARDRTLTRLAKLHPAQYRILLDQERGR